MAEKKVILYVDDEEINVQLFRINFSLHFDVLTGNSGFDGLALLEKHPETNVIISDMKMPEMNGLEFIARAKEKYPEKRFYILTGYEITDEIQEALSTGLIRRYFSKPFNMHEIEGAINEE